MNALLNDAWAADCDEPSDKLVLVYLADRANVNGKAWPHLPTIARQTGLCKRTINAVLQRLEARQHLTISRRQGCSNSYVVHPKQDAPGSRVTVALAQPLRRTRAATALPPAQPLRRTRAATALPPAQPLRQQPNLQGIPRGTGRPSPRFKRENWQLIRDEEALTNRIKKEVESCQPDKVLIESLKAERYRARNEMKGQ